MGVSRSMQEEVVAVLWIIAAVLAFGHGFDGWGWAFAIKGGIDTWCAIYFAVRESVAEQKAAEKKIE